ncbi:MAG: D-aminoacyl-tRNA deacylase [Salinisphaera sp.]|nr:D-aminoacyl-tRNA deacylase [Salinisphaera sp.]
MIGLLQRVTQAQVTIGGEMFAHIDAGLLVLAAVRVDDEADNVDRLVQRILDFHLFADGQGRMNRSLSETGGGLLLVPQFTLAADTRKGRRASFSGAAAPDRARLLFARLVDTARLRHHPVASGRFGADMQVALTNDGPVTFWLEA